MEQDQTIKAINGNAWRFGGVGLAWCVVVFVLAHLPEEYVRGADFWGEGGMLNYMMRVGAFLGFMICQPDPSLLFLTNPLAFILRCVADALSLAAHLYFILTPLALMVLASERLRCTRKAAFARWSALSLLGIWAYPVCSLVYDISMPGESPRGVKFYMIAFAYLLGMLCIGYDWVGGRTVKGVPVMDRGVVREDGSRSLNSNDE